MERRRSTVRFRATEPACTFASFTGRTSGSSRFEELKDRDAEIAQPPTTQPWGGTDFHARDPDGNVISFVIFG
jgi:uncharacterized glyoxalase superfamily protein PhnB